jgi:hypothetical protein
MAWRLRLEWMREVSALQSRGDMEEDEDDTRQADGLDNTHDIAVICEVVNLLLGPHAVEWSKFYAGRQIE